MIWVGFIQFCVRVGTILFLEPFVHRQCMTNSILNKFSLGIGIGGGYSPTASAASVFGIIDAVVREMIWVFAFEKDIQILKSEFPTFMLPDFIGQHDCIACIRLGRFAAFRLGRKRRLMSSFSDVVGWWLERRCMDAWSTMTRGMLGMWCGCDLWR